MTQNALKNQFTNELYNVILVNVKNTKKEANHGKICQGSLKKYSILMLFKVFLRINLQNKVAIFGELFKIGLRFT